MSDRDLRPFAAHLQGLGIGLVLGMTTALAAVDRVAIYAIPAISVIVITVGYIIDKRTQNTESAQTEVA